MSKRTPSNRIDNPTGDLSHGARGAPRTGPGLKGQTDDRSRQEWDTRRPPIRRGPAPDPGYTRGFDGRNEKLERAPGSAELLREVKRRLPKMSGK